MSTRRPAADDDWKISVRLTLDEVDQVAHGRLPRSLVRYCREGLQHWEGSAVLASVRARAARRKARRAR